MAAGRVVFHGATATLSDAAARELYGIASDGAGESEATAATGTELPAGAVEHAA